MTAFRAGADGRRREFLRRALTVGVVTLVVAGGLWWFSSYMFDQALAPRCGAGVMEPGDTCENLRTGVFTSSADEAASSQRVTDFAGWASLVAGIVVAAVGILAALNLLLIGLARRPPRDSA
ncbi:hypothetical protein [Pseudonocardia sp. KRD291]|uniref:hypothetical protein n=1 Tax=Pseudonocardia sp. KRD291 TaxID=2792007 RepID=UPI001C4A57AF|nr:hypothetical protein [Pseudonocardia sp. KRD291]MBW0106414.1 hypothetical protein [Pseudonocardia sp. KRD291]